MKKQLPNHLWESFLDLLRKPDTLENYESYYNSMVFWIKNNYRNFTEELLKCSRLDVLININPEFYLNDCQDFYLESELKRFENNRPSSINTFAMIVGDRLWEMVAIKSGIDCPNCMDEFRYVLIEKPSGEKNVVLECESCAWSENIDGTKLDEGLVKVMPANKQDLKKFGIQ